MPNAAERAERGKLASPLPQALAAVRYLVAAAAATAETTTQAQRLSLPARAGQAVHTPLLAAGQQALVGPCQRRAQTARQEQATKVGQAVGVVAQPWRLVLMGNPAATVAFVAAVVAAAGWARTPALAALAALAGRATLW
jgi:hypothetical protein